MPKRTYNIFEYGVGLAHQANESRDLMLENEAQLAEQVDLRRRKLGELGLEEALDNGMAIHATTAMVEVERVKFDTLMEHACHMLNSSFVIEEAIKRQAA